MSLLQCSLHQNSKYLRVLTLPTQETCSHRSPFSTISCHLRLNLLPKHHSSNRTASLAFHPYQYNGSTGLLLKYFPLLARDLDSCSLIHSCKFLLALPTCHFLFHSNLNLWPYLQVYFKIQYHRNHPCL
jgi:hypothetical protein